VHRLPAFGKARSRQERERVCVPWAHHPEMSVIERGDLSNSESLRKRDHRRVARTEGKIGIRVDEVSHPRIVAGGEFDGPEVADGEVSQECGLGPGLPL
jgi:hypothetical protein